MLRALLTLGVVAYSATQICAQDATNGVTTSDFATTPDLPATDGVDIAPTDMPVTDMPTTDAPPSANPPVAANDGGNLGTTQGPAAECQPYYHAPIANALASFPPIWQPATILQGDDNAMAKWATIQPSVPDIAPKGTLQGNFSAQNYPVDDPDCWWTSTKCNNPKTPNIPGDVYIMPEPRTLGYGFDDGPNCSHNAFYDFLQSQNQKATMFFVGSNIMDWPLEAARAVSDGHEVCIHSWSHQYMTAFESADAFAELYYSMQALKIATGVTPTCWRPPFGDVDDRIRAIAAGLGLRTVLWQYDSQDWQVGSAAGITSASVDNEYQTMIDDANKGLFNSTGTMILMHELNEYTMSETMKFYPKLKAAFDHIVPVGVGMNVTRPYVEDGYVMPNFIQYISARENLVTNSTNTTTTVSPNSTASSEGFSPSSTDTDADTRKSSASRLTIWTNGGGVTAIVAFMFGLVVSAAVDMGPLN